MIYAASEKMNKNIKIKNKLKLSFWIGLIILILLLAGYFIKINIDSGFNYELKDSLLGILIFHNPFMLGLYVLIAIVLIVNGLTKRRR